MDYNSLVAVKGTSGAIRTFTKYNEIDVEAVLEDAQMYIYERLRIKEMRQWLELTTNTTDSFLYAPGNILDAVSLQMRLPKLDVTLRNEEALFALRVYDDDGELITGVPQNYCIISDRIVFDVLPDAEYRMDLLYFGTIGILSAETPQTYLTARYPHIVRQACVGFAGQHMKDYDEAATALKLCDAMIDDAKVMDDLSRRGQRA